MDYTRWKGNTWNAICDRCGFKFKNTDLLQDYQGLMVCKTCFEHRHPQELLRPVQDQHKLPWTQPEGDDSTVTLTDGCTQIGRQAAPNYAIPNCAIPNLDLGLRDTLAETEEFH